MIEAAATRVAADSILSRLTGAVLFGTLALGLVVPNAVDAGLVALVLLALGWLAGSGQLRRPGLGRLERFYLLMPVLFVLAWLAAWWLHGTASVGMTTAERLPKLLAIVPLYLFLRRVDGLDGAWWNGLVAGCLVAGGYALWYTWTGQQGVHGTRVPGPTNPIYFGGLSLAYGLMLIPRLADERQSTPARVLTIAAIVLAFVANALSGSRGAWLAIPALLCIYLFTAGAGQPLRWRLGVPFVIAALSLVVLLTPVLPMSDRLDETLAELSLITEGGNGNGGFGLRVQLWEVAGGLIGAEPLTGTGPGSFRLALVESVQAGDFSKGLLRYDHPHNQYLSALIDGGIGLLAVLAALFAAPILLVSGLSRRYSRQCRYLAWCALAAGVVLAIMALSESIFERSAGVVWYALLTSVSAALAVGSGHQAPD
ncbi:O-antigen ligase family protein [Wenzhouxiangella sediminis]|uniref:O-antigen ligase domain-containing protein n=1 Tax=Wenzhouxiangella sediminis TaxID=1792836 RepID=A0A3E1KBR3_9GAMM|nr:O-antigen ligase family protein [Wenzhouxiangella sediminis]RFF32124.1 O-antigen ligase domain-containing protein [Wenzhouxiangella sediminis]